MRQALPKWWLLVCATPGISLSLTLSIPFVVPVCVCEENCLVCSQGLPEWLAFPDSCENLQDLVLILPSISAKIKMELENFGFFLSMVCVCSLECLVDYRVEAARKGLSICPSSETMRRWREKSYCTASEQKETSTRNTPCDWHVGRAHYEVKNSLRMTYHTTCTYVDNAWDKRMESLYFA